MTVSTIDLSTPVTPYVPDNTPSGEQITATGTTSGTAAAITKRVNDVISSASNTGVILPAASGELEYGEWIDIRNASDTREIQVYVNGSDVIEGYTSPLTIRPKCGVRISKYSSSRWIPLFTDGEGLLYRGTTSHGSVQNTASATFVTLTGSSLSVTVPARHKALISYSVTATFGHSNLSVGVRFRVHLDGATLGLEHAPTAKVAGTSGSGDTFSQTIYHDLEPGTYTFDTRVRTNSGTLYVAACESYISAIFKPT